MKTRKFFSAVAAVALLSALFVSCSPNSLADEDTLYENQQGIEVSKIKVPENG